MYAKDFQGFGYSTWVSIRKSIRESKELIRENSNIISVKYYMTQILYDTK